MTSKIMNDIALKANLVNLLIDNNVEYDSYLLDTMIRVINQKPDLQLTKAFMNFMDNTDPYGEEFLSMIKTTDESIQ